MNLMPPFIAQERPDTCAIACLRMILAYLDIDSTETEMIEAAAMEPGGLNPEELARLAGNFGLRAQERQLDRGALFSLVRHLRFPIVFLYRGPIDRVQEAHAVIPVRLSHRYVHFLDPLKGNRRISIRKFEKARRLVGQWVVVWEDLTE